MKSLIQYITEKLIINKDYKKESSYACDPSSDRGTCIQVSIPTVDERSEYIFILDKVCQYHINGNVSNIEYSTGYEQYIIKNSEGFYIVNEPDNEYWRKFVLFGDGALNFLNDLLNASEHTIMTDKFKDSRFKLKKGHLPCVNYTHNNLSNQQIEKMIKQIEELL